MMAELEELRVQRDLMSARCVELAARMHAASEEFAARLQTAEKENTALRDKLALFERHGSVPEGHAPKLPAELMRGLS